MERASSDAMEMLAQLQDMWGTVVGDRTQSASPLPNFQFPRSPPDVFSGSSSSASPPSGAAVSPDPFDFAFAGSSPPLSLAATSSSPPSSFSSTPSSPASSPFAMDEPSHFSNPPPAASRSPADDGSKRPRPESPPIPDEERDIKKQKRKMSNRLAAQNSRERKKRALMDLEVKVAELNAQNKQLQEQIAALTKESQEARKSAEFWKSKAEQQERRQGLLLQPQQQLESKVRTEEGQQHLGRQEAGKAADVSSVESAALSTSLQQSEGTSTAQYFLLNLQIQLMTFLLSMLVSPLVAPSSSSTASSSSEMALASTGSPSPALPQSPAALSASLARSLATSPPNLRDPNDASSAAAPIPSPIPTPSPSDPAEAATLAHPRLHANPLQASLLQQLLRLQQQLQQLPAGSLMAPTSSLPHGDQVFQTLISTMSSTLTLLHSTRTLPFGCSIPLVANPLRQFKANDNSLVTACS